MTRKVSFIFVLLSFLILNSCILFTAESDFYINNGTSFTLTVSWINDEDINQTILVSINETVILENSVMGETNDIKPTFVFKSLKATRNISGSDVEVYNQSPIDNAVWQKTSGNKNRYYIYTLNLTDADLTP